MAHTPSDVDRVLLQFGKLGRFQLMNYVALSLPIMISAMYTVAYVFSAQELLYRCCVSECEDGWEYLPEWLTGAVPFSGSTPSPCERYVQLWRNLSHDHCDAAGFSAQVEQCDSWVFLPGQRSTISNEWGITCDDTWKLSFVGTINNIGLFVGMPLSGLISDRFGRKRLLMWAWTLCSLMGLLRSFATNYEMYIAFEFLDAFFGAGVYGAGFLLALEFFGPDTRVTAATVLSLFYSLGGVVLGLIAWGVTQWRWYLRVIYISGLICLPFIGPVPESVRWLASQTRYKEADSVIRRVANINGMRVVDTLEDSARKSDEEVPDSDGKLHKEHHGCFRAGSTTSDLLETMKSRTLLLRFANCAFCWMANTFVYYGLSLYSVALAGNEYLNFILSSTVELPANLLQLVVMNTLGRRISQGGSLIISGMCCIAFIFIPEDIQWLRLTIYMVGKFAITISFSVVYVYTAELFPTNVRHSLVGYASMFGRVGSMVAPQAPLLAGISEHLPLALFGGASLLSGVLAFFFPETKDCPLPESIKEAIEIGKKA